jgi:hypothetical protein
MTEAETSSYLDLPRATLRQWRWLDKGPPYARAGRSIRYSQRAVDRWLAENTVVAATPPSFAVSSISACWTSSGGVPLATRYPWSSDVRKALRHGAEPYLRSCSMLRVPKRRWSLVRMSIAKAASSASGISAGAR